MRLSTIAILAVGLAVSLPSPALAYDASNYAAGLTAPKAGKTDYELNCSTCLKPVSGGAGYKNAVGTSKKTSTQKQSGPAQSR